MYFLFWSHIRPQPSRLGLRGAQIMNSLKGGYFSLPRWWVLEIKRMYPALRTHGLFLTWTHTRQCYLQITHTTYMYMHRCMYTTEMIFCQPTPLLPVLALSCPFHMIQPLFLLTWRSCFFCSWCEYPSTLVPGLLSMFSPCCFTHPRHPIHQVTYLHRWHQQHQPSRLTQLLLNTYTKVKLWQQPVTTIFLLQ